MLCCFLSENRCAVKINGEPVGFAGNNLQILPLCLRDAFIEFLPLGGNLAPIFTQVQNPSGEKNLRVVDLCGGVLLLPRFERIDKKKPFEFVKLNGASICFFYSQTTSTLIETANGSAFFDLGYLDNPKAELLNERFLAIIGKRKKRKTLRLFDLSQKPNLIFSRECDDFSFENELVLTTKNLGVCRIEKREVINFDSPEKSYCSFTREIPVFSLKDELLPYAFLEEVFLKSNYQDYLSRDLKENEAFVNEFIGEFEFFLPPVFNDGITLIRKGKQKADFLQIKAKNGCVEDLNFL